MKDVVWLKKDLRVVDHEAFFTAVESGNEVVALFIYEPEVMGAADFSRRHFLFQNECLEELDGVLGKMGGGVVFRTGEAVEVLAELRGEIGEFRLLSHEETGNGVTFSRDVRVKKWCEREGVEWVEFSQNGVVRRLGDRDGWSRRWLGRMVRGVFPAPAEMRFVKGMFSEGLRGAEEFGIPDDGAAEGDDLGLHRQRGGRALALEYIESFLYVRGAGYTKEMSSPVSGYEACSRISPYLTFGALSVKEAFQIGMARKAELAELKARGERVDPRWGSALKSFLGRLRWHCHFMQKLEDEPQIEWENFSPVYDELRAGSWCEERFLAWKEGKTGYPMVDACMRAVRATGFLNFRMRAMVMSFSSYHLWLHWRRPGEYLAQMFTDYEPGIHWSQSQMQSGTTGINTIRIYSPRKQVEDQDPEGVFLKRWLPELRDVPLKYIAEPHLMPYLEQCMAGCVIGKDYPFPIVDHGVAFKAAQEKVRGLRKTSPARSQAAAVQKKHGSRKKNTRSWR